jgi:GNAT superfamily N-acetyltransferase
MQSCVIFVEKIPARATWALRQSVLRPGQALERVQYPEDSHPGAFHWGAFVLDEAKYHISAFKNIKESKLDPKLVGIASIYAEPPVLRGASIDRADEVKIGWRLRGMAVDPTFRNRNVGAILLNTLYAYVLTTSKSGIWCNGRSTVAPYYRGMGFKVIGDEFDMPGIGPHYVMVNPDPDPIRYARKFKGGKLIAAPEHFFNQNNPSMMLR